MKSCGCRRRCAAPSPLHAAPRRHAHRPRLRLLPQAATGRFGTRLRRKARRVGLDRDQHVKRGPSPETLRAAPRRERRRKLPSAGPARAPRRGHVGRPRLRPKRRGKHYQEVARRSTRRSARPPTRRATQAGGLYSSRTQCAARQREAHQPDALLARRRGDTVPGASRTSSSPATLRRLLCAHHGRRPRRRRPGRGAVGVAASSPTRRRPRTDRLIDPGADDVARRRVGPYPRRRLLELRETPAPARCSSRATSTTPS